MQSISHYIQYRVFVKHTEPIQMSGPILSGAPTLTKLPAPTMEPSPSIVAPKTPNSRCSCCILPLA
jgi:hypothetical protein